MKNAVGCLTLVITAVSLLLGGILSPLKPISTATTPVSTPEWAVFPMVSTPSTTEAVYQSFEHGFIVWRADMNCAYAIEYSSLPGNTGLAIIPNHVGIGYGYCLNVAPLKVQPISSMPAAGLTLPTGVLGKVWDYYPEIQLGLGEGTQRELDYVANIPYETKHTEARKLNQIEDYYVVQMTLPSGDTFACGAGAALAGTCQY